MEKLPDERVFIEQIIPHTYFQNNMEHIQNRDRFASIEPDRSILKNSSIFLLEQKFKQLEKHKSANEAKQLLREPLGQYGGQQQLLANTYMHQQNILTEKQRQMLQNSIAERQQKQIRETAYCPYSSANSESNSGLDSNYFDMEKHHIQQNFFPSNIDSRPHALNASACHAHLEHQYHVKSWPVRTPAIRHQQALDFNPLQVSGNVFFQTNTDVASGKTSSNSATSPEYSHVTAHAHKLASKAHANLLDDSKNQTRGLNSGFLSLRTVVSEPFLDECAYSNGKSGSTLTVRQAQPSDAELRIELALGRDRSYHQFGSAQSRGLNDYAGEKHQEINDLEPDTTLRL